MRSSVKMQCLQMPPESSMSPRRALLEEGARTSTEKFISRLIACGAITCEVILLIAWIYERFPWELLISFGRQ
jgi:hypothetical protein